jgi:hypothetical protein
MVYHFTLIMLKDSHFFYKFYDIKKMVGYFRIFFMSEWDFKFKSMVTINIK